LIYYRVLTQSKLNYPQEALDKAAKERDSFQDTTLKLSQIWALKWTN